VRFQKLLQAKKYPSIVDEDFYDLPAVFCSFWREKIRLERVGMKIDNLLNTDVVNPELLLPEEADLAYRKWINA
jgi:hypothetical protein